MCIRDRGESFVAETVFSHPSKLHLITRARRSGYVVVLHIVLVPVELSVARVAERVVEGGHFVPEDKIRGRYARLWVLVSAAIGMVDHATVYDNSAPDVTRIVARFVDGDHAGTAQWPSWAPHELIEITEPSLEV